MSLTDGSAYHAGVAYALAKGDWGSGMLEAARASFDKEIQAVGLLDAEVAIAEDNWDLTCQMLKLYEENFKTEQVVMIQPEVEFRVPLTEEKHWCIWRHWRHRVSREDIWRPPTADEILAKVVTSPHPEAHRSYGEYHCPCYTPHEVVGKIDGIFMWKGALWIMDHKTTALPPSAFWDQWDLSYQPTIYVYGAEKALGIRPKGFIINAIFKPSEAQVGNWNSKRKNGIPPKGVQDYIKYEREARLRSDEDVERARLDFISICDEWEWRILRGEFPLSPTLTACRQYNRVCEFKPICTSHAEATTLEGYTVKSDYDYVEKVLYQIEPAEEAAK